MGKAIYTLGSAPTVSIKRCGGDLTIEGRADETVTMATDTMPHSVQGHEQLVIEECDDDLRLSVPPEATVSVDHVDGDAHVEGLSALEMSSVGGDLELRAIERSCSVRSVDGDMQATDVAVHGCVQREAGVLGHVHDGVATHRGLILPAGRE